MKNMERKGLLRIASTLLAVLLVFGCASKKGVENSTGVKVNELTELSINDQGKQTEIKITAKGELTPNVFKLTDPLRVIIDLTDTRLGEVKGPFAVNNGIINEITTSQFDDVTSSLSRIVIGFDKVVDYRVNPKDNLLAIIIPKVPGEFAETETSVTVPEVPVEEEIAEAPAVAQTVPETASPKIEEVPEVSEGEVPETQVPVSSSEEPIVEAEEAVSPVEEVKSAGRIEDIQFETSDIGTSVYITFDGEISEWDDFVLEKPTRLVIDLVGVKNAFKERKKINIGSAEVGSIRLGEYKDKVRMVLDYPESKKPSYTVSKENKRLVLNIFPEVPKEVAKALEPAEVAPKEAPIEEVIPEVAETPAQETETPVLVEEAPKEEPKRAPKTTLTSLDFKQVPQSNKSRLVISTDEPAFYTTKEEGGGNVVIELSNTFIPNNSLRRFIDTSSFASAVTKITPQYSKKSNTSTFVIKLKEAVPYSAYQEGSQIIVDFDIPASMLAKAEVPKAAPMEEPEIEEAENKVERIERVKPAKEPIEDKMKYAVVKEEFLSDRLEGGPLTEMGSVLAETWGGKQRFTGRRISLDFKNAELKSIFRLLAEVSKFNLIMGDDVGGRITVRLENVPWDQAFAIILQTKQLWYEKYGNIVRIAPAEKLRKEKEAAIANQKAAVEAKPIDVLFKPISYAEAGNIAARVKPIMSPRGTVDIDARTNTLIIRDVKEYLEAAKSLIEKLDTQTPQVSIEARIVEASTRSRKGWGIRWGGNVNFSPATGNPTGLFFPNTVAVNNIALNYPSPVGSNASAGIALGSLNNVVDLDLTIELMESSGEGKLISSPKVTVLDNSTANIMSGTKIPYITQTANSGSSVRFENAVISLNVTPHVTADGSVSMKINATRNEPDKSIVIDGNPAISQRVITTEVLVKSGNTTVLGGIYKINKERSKESFPFLSKIPLLGYLFRNWSREVNKEELLIFITPRIVGDERKAVRDIKG